MNPTLIKTQTAIFVFLLCFATMASAQFEPGTAFRPPQGGVPAPAGDNGFSAPALPENSVGLRVAKATESVTAQNANRGEGAKAKIDSGWSTDAPGESSTEPGSVSEEGGLVRATGPRRLLDILQSGGPLMIPIGICSFILVVFVFERFISLRKGHIIPGPFTRRFLEELRDGSLDQEEAILQCENNGSAMANVFKAGILRWGRPAVEIEQAVLDEGERSSNRLRKYLRLINGIATVCPLLGLLGTVLGMIHAFDSIASVTAGADPKALIATGISQALLTTAAGLSVAIPALIAYLFFSSRADKHVMEIDSLGMQVVNLVSAETLSSRQPNKRASRAA